MPLRRDGVAVGGNPGLDGADPRNGGGDGVLLHKVPELDLRAEAVRGLLNRRSSSTCRSARDDEVGGGAGDEEVDVVELVDLVEARLLNNSGGVGIGGEEDGVGRQLPLDEEGMDGWD